LASCRSRRIGDARRAGGAAATGDAADLAGRLGLHGDRVGCPLDSTAPKLNEEAPEVMVAVALPLARTRPEADRPLTVPDSVRDWDEPLPLLPPQAASVRSVPIAAIRGSRRCMRAPDSFDRFGERC